eukprot:m.138620 g.138620  ORF g.138620 m.138620 type:complete len:118 (+) comp9963_c0_seq7:1366-1719(+)
MMRYFAIADRAGFGLACGPSSELLLVCLGGGEDRVQLTRPANFSWICQQPERKVSLSMLPQTRKGIVLGFRVMLRLAQSCEGIRVSQRAPFGDISVSYMPPDSLPPKAAFRHRPSPM